MQLCRRFGQLGEHGEIRNKSQIVRVLSPSFMKDIKEDRRKAGQFLPSQSFGAHITDHVFSDAISIC